MQGSQRRKMIENFKSRLHLSTQPASFQFLLAAHDSRHPQDEMARNEEKAQSMLNRWLSGKTKESRGEKATRPYLASECNDLNEADKWRQQILRDIGRKVMEIQNAGLGEHRWALGKQGRPLQGPIGGVQRPPAAARSPPPRFPATRTSPHGGASITRALQDPRPERRDQQAHTRERALGAADRGAGRPRLLQSGAQGHRQRGAGAGRGVGAWAGLPLLWCRQTASRRARAVREGCAAPGARREGDRTVGGGGGAPRAVAASSYACRKLQLGLPLHAPPHPHPTHPTHTWSYFFPWLALRAEGRFWESSLPASPWPP